MKNKLIGGSASIFSLKNFTCDLYLYLYFRPVVRFITQSNDFIFTGFILGLHKIIQINQIKKLHLITIRKLTFLK
jgi:hypothetical protein